MRIALYGINGLYNYGCEAIVRGTFEIIKKRYPDATIDYISKDVVRDSAILKDININVLPDFPNKLIWIIEKIIVRAERMIDTKIESYNRKLYKGSYK